MVSQKKLGIGSVMVALAVVTFSVDQLSFAAASGDTVEDATAEEARRLSHVFPDADVFSASTGELPHHKAYKTDSVTGERTLLGFVFMTHMVDPLEFAYTSEIEALVGVAITGNITKVEIVDHYEPYGYFSIDLPEFAKQFEGKSILDRFYVDRDIDAVTRATITVEGTARVIRNTAREIIRQHLREQEKK